jgi:hypothetical protein
MSHILRHSMGQAMAQLVEALRYKPEGLGLNPRWCHWHYGPGIESTF